MEELWNKLGAWGYAVPILMLLCLNILLFTEMLGISREYYRENKKEKILVIYVIFRIFFLFKS